MKPPPEGPEHLNQLYSHREKDNGQPFEIKDLSFPLPFPNDALLRQHASTQMESHNNMTPHGPYNYLCR